MVESSLKLCAGGATDGTVPFLGFANKDIGERTKRYMRVLLTNMSS